MNQVFSESAEIDAKNRGKTPHQDLKTLKSFLPKETYQGKPRRVYKNCKKCGNPIPKPPFKYMGVCAMCDFK